jgi:hypothetical protein
MYQVQNGPRDTHCPATHCWEPKLLVLATASSSYPFSVEYHLQFVVRDECCGGLWMSVSPDTCKAQTRMGQTTTVGNLPHP